MNYCEDCSSYDCGCFEQKRIAELEQQLAEREKQIVMLRSYLKRWAFTQSDDECAHMEVQEALDLTSRPVRLHPL